MPATLPPPDKAASAAAAPPVADPKPAAQTADPSISDIESKFNAWSETQNEPPPADAAAKEPAKEPPKDEKKTSSAPPKQPAKDDRTATTKEPKEPKELRAQLDKVNGEATTLRETVASLEAKIKDAEAKGKDVTALTERLTAREKELEEKDRTIRSLKREKDPKFIDEFEKPFNQAADYAKVEIEQLLVNNEDGTTRPATWDDFRVLYGQPQGKAIVAARAMFGDAAQVVVNHLTELKRLDYRHKTALAEENKRWETEQKEMQAKEAQQREESNALRMKALKYVEESQPEWFRAKPEDKEAAELLAKGRAFVTGQPKTAGEAALLHATIFHRAAAHDLLVKRNETLKAENEALRTQVEELKGSEPGKTQRGGSDEGSTKTEKSWEDEVREAASHA